MRPGNFNSIATSVLQFCILHWDCTISINNINRMNLDLMSVLVPTFKLGINDAVFLAEGDYLNITCFGLLVIKFQYPFKIFTACHNRIFMFCSAKVTWFMQNTSESIECLRSHLSGLAWETGTSPKPTPQPSHISVCTLPY